MLTEIKGNEVLVGNQSQMTKVIVRPEEAWTRTEIVYVSDARRLRDCTEKVKSESSAQVFNLEVDEESEQTLN